MRTIVLLLLAVVCVPACDPGACYDIAPERVTAACVGGVATVLLPDAVDELAVTTTEPDASVWLADGGVSVACTGPVVFVLPCR